MTPVRLAAVAVFAAATLPASAVAAAPRANLAVSGATAHYRGGRLTGSFAVRVTRHRAPATTATVSVTLPSHAKALVRRYAIRGLAAGRVQTVRVSAKLPAHLPAGVLPIRVCADSGRKVRERSEADNCQTLVRVRVSGTGSGSGASATPTPSPGQPSQPSAGSPATPPSTTPSGLPQQPAGPTRPSSAVTAPLSYAKNAAFDVRDAVADYWTYVPSSYDDSHRTPSKLLIWLHGCDRTAAEAIPRQTAPSQDWITIFLGGRDNACWDAGDPADQKIVMTALADVETHFNIDPRQVVIGGYSSGGNLAYRMAFYNAYAFAGVLAENTAPFSGTRSTAQQSLAAAYWKFNVVHLAHDVDDAYPLAQVTSEVQRLKDAGYPATLVVRPGPHDDHRTPTDVADVLLGHMDDGWLAPP